MCLGLGEEFCVLLKHTPSSFIDFDHFPEPMSFLARIEINLVFSPSFQEHSSCYILDVLQLNYASFDLC